MRSICLHNMLIATFVPFVNMSEFPQWSICFVRSVILYCSVDNKNGGMLQIIRQKGNYFPKARLHKTQQRDLIKTLAISQIASSYQMIYERHNDFSEQGFVVWCSGMPNAPGRCCIQHRAGVQVKVWRTDHNEWWMIPIQRMTHFRRSFSIMINGSDTDFIQYLLKVPKLRSSCRPIANPSINKSPEHCHQG